MISIEKKNVRILQIMRVVDNIYPKGIVNKRKTDSVYQINKRKFKRGT